MKKSKPPCMAPGCPNQANSRTYCKAHELRLRRGKPLDTPLRPRGDGRLKRQAQAAIDEETFAALVADMNRNNRRTFGEEARHALETYVREHVSQGES